MVLAVADSSSPDVGPALEDLPGYANAEIQVARDDPRIPLQVFEEARKTRLASPPPAVSFEFLQAHVRFLAEHVFRLGASSEPRKRGQPKSAPSARRKKGAAG